VEDPSSGKKALLETVEGSLHRWCERTDIVLGDVVGQRKSCPKQKGQDAGFNLEVLLAFLLLE